MCSAGSVEWFVARARMRSPRLGAPGEDAGLRRARSKRMRRDGLSDELNRAGRPLRAALALAGDPAAARRSTLRAGRARVRWSRGRWARALAECQCEAIARCWIAVQGQRPLIGPPTEPNLSANHAGRSAGPKIPARPPGLGQGRPPANPRVVTRARLQLQVKRVWLPRATTRTSAWKPCDSSTVAARRRGSVWGGWVGGLAVTGGWWRHGGPVRDLRAQDPG